MTGDLTTAEQLTAVQVQRVYTRLASASFSYVWLALQQELATGHDPVEDDVMRLGRSAWAAFISRPMYKTQLALDLEGEDGTPVLEDADLEAWLGGLRREWRIMDLMSQRLPAGENRRAALMRLLLAQNGVYLHLHDEEETEEHGVSLPEKEDLPWPGQYL